MIKVERRKEPPKSLAIEKMKSQGKYNNFDVVDALNEDFENKCYICGLKGLQEIEVEHLIPHYGDIDKKFDWNNLFLSCPHCNSVKNKKKYNTGIIDCCVSDPEERLLFHIYQNKVKVVAVNKDDVQAQLTADLMYETFNVSNTGIRTITCKYRYNELLKQMNLLYKVLEEKKNKPKSKVIDRKLNALLSRSSAFAEFKRCYYREHIGELL